MMYKSTDLLTIYLDAWNQHHKVGRLAVKHRRILFEYDAAFIASGIEISQIKLPLRLGVLVWTALLMTAVRGFQR
jgi:serine/threonine-protein kinase HipA